MSAFGAAVLGIAALFTPVPALAAPAALVAPDHSTLVSELTTDKTPNINDGNVLAIYDAGSKVIVGGSFTNAQNRGSSPTPVDRRAILAFDKATGKIDNAFVPLLDGDVNALIAGPTPGTVYVAGRFNKVGDKSMRKLALLNVEDGSLVDGFKNPAFDGAVSDVLLVGDHLLVGGNFTSTNGATRNGLVSLDPTTGAVDDYLTVALTEHHNWTPTNGGASAAVGTEKMAVSPDGKHLVVIGNFKKADGAVHDQIVRIDLGASSAKVADWNTDGYAGACKYSAFDSWVRDVQFSPDSKYFVVVSTGASYPGTLCDSAARWETDATGAGQKPTWTNFSGGDTFLSVGISEKAIYVGGHFRWSNNPLARDKAGPGAVPRASIAALDPLSGLPLAWNPGRNPRGYGVTEMLVTPQGLWLGSDQEWIGNYEYQRKRLAFFPLTGGDAPHSTSTKGLPGDVYQAGRAAQTEVLYRVNAGGPAIPATDGGPDWSADTDATPSPYHNGGNSAKSYPTNATFDATVPTSTPATLFNTERWDQATAPDMQWDIPVAAGTRVNVRIYLANRYAGTAAPGKRKLDVSIDGVLKMNDFDPVAVAGGTDRGTMQSFSVVSDGVVDIDFGRVLENPLVQGIEIVKTAPTPDASDVLYRVNAGGEELAAPSGPAWAADTLTAPISYHNAGNTVSTYPTEAALDATVPAGTPATLFRSERWDQSPAPDMQWDFPVPAGTPVQVRLYLANRYAGTATAGKRKFNVSIDGVQKLSNFDPVAAIGATNKGSMRAFAVTSDGNVDIDFGRVLENPLVQGIEIVKLPPVPPATTVDSITKRSYDGATGVGNAMSVPNSDDTRWSEVKGAFWVGGDLFYGVGGDLHKRSFDGSEFGAAKKVDPYHDAKWDKILTGSAPEGQTYAGMTVNFSAELPNVTAMFYKSGRVYYTLAGQSALFWRGFAPDTGTVGAERATVTGTTGFADAAGLFLDGDKLYVVSRSTGNLSSMDWADGAPTGSATLRSGPGVDDVDWRGTAVFVGP
ncbi:malectin domain-containing carbohydrate-binding protein [Micromonospora sp. WMMC241]|uniref:malectin domain-containing carbohydrate-binding protein n=1 Tax=Micromonospora sp. WMMC241 TaxID=3015159 RepID=UPI0022B6FE22|nr:malectin domain-containing carbohydrate-binding protein [Micromonospora sp. WMMC241]MCZ7440760.1 malectin domain-containing carbohydrate-binding protein [Micromonospora sp. WMMC241]